jgi:hypothetical protein
MSEYAHLAKQSFTELFNEVSARIQILEEKEQRWVEIEKQMQANIDAADKKIVLDIGGKRFATSKSTLLSHKGSFFESMLAYSDWKPDENGAYFIDRNPKLFPIILDFLRMGKISLKGYAYDTVLEDLQTEFNFYQIALPEETLPTTLFAESKLLSLDQKRILTKWLGNNATTSLLYSATRDGFGASSFHSKCDNKGPTVTLVSTPGCLFGGYTSIHWDNTGTYKSSADSFLFTLSNPHKIPPTKYHTQSGANVYCHSLYGPTFGTGHDLHICNNSNTSNSSYTNFPSTYIDTTGHGQSTFAGSYHFQTNDIEVYQVIE